MSMFEYLAVTIRFLLV